jgi:gluconate 2-dehydrogenase gamma chain
MPLPKLGRRGFLGAVGAAAAGAVPAPAPAPTPPTPTGAAKAPDAPAGYMFFKPSESAFVEAMVDHMCPRDELTGSGTEIGLAVFVDRALAGSWGKGDRFYAEGPWKSGTPNQGYQLPMNPAELYRAGIAASDAYCLKTYAKTFARCTAAQKEAFLKDLAGGKIALDGGLPGRAFFDLAYETVVEGMFADPIYGGNKDKACWKMIGFPGVVATHAQDIRSYSDGKRFVADPLSIADMS